jgi:hypothetical protein
MPLSQFQCSICGKKAPKRLLRHGQFPKRMEWLRDHRKAEHPRAFRQSILKGVRARQLNVKLGKPRKPPADLR